MKKLIRAVIVLLALGALVAGARFLPAEEKAAAPVTLEGTIVDMHCYVTHGINDAAHTKCANACIARGIPAGLLAWDGTLYVLFEEKPFSVKDRVAGLADVAVRVVGIPSTRGGIKGLQVQTVEKLKK